MRAIWFGAVILILVSTAAPIGAACADDIGVLGPPAPQRSDVGVVGTRTPSSTSEEKPLGRVGEIKRDAPETTNSASVARFAGSLAAVLGLIGILALAVLKIRKSRPGLAGALGLNAKAPAGIIEVLGRYPIGPGQLLLLLRIKRRVLLVSQQQGRSSLRGGGGAGAMTTLCELTDADEVAAILSEVEQAPGATKGLFKSLMDRFDQRHADERSAPELSTHSVVADAPMNIPNPAPHPTAAAAVTRRQRPVHRDAAADLRRRLEGWQAAPMRGEA